MRLQREDGVSAQFITWNLSCTERSFVVVALDDGSLEEWALKGCRVIEGRKTSLAVDGAAQTPNSDYTAALEEELQQYMGMEYFDFTDETIHELATRLNSVVKAQQNCA